MKIAICFSGSLRQFKTCYGSFKKNILDANDCDADIFVSTWKSKIEHFKKPVLDEGTFKEMLELYNPAYVSRESYGQAKRMELYEESRISEFQKQAKNFHKCQGVHKGPKCRFCGHQIIHNQVGQLYNIWKVNELRKEYEKTNGKYDLVIRTRFDNYFFDNLTDSMVEQALNGRIWIPYGFDDLPRYGGGVNDQFAIGTPEAMDVYCDMYPNIYKYIMKRATTKEGYGALHSTIVDAAEEKETGIERFMLKYVIYKKLGLYKKKTKGMNDEEYKEIKV